MAMPRKEKTQFNNFKQAAEALNIPVAHIKLMKQLCPDAWTSNNQIISEVLIKFYEENKEMILETQSESLESLKKQKLTNDVILQNIEIESKKKQVVNIKDIQSFMENFGIQLGAVLKSKITKELPPRITGLSEEDVTKICKEYYNELCELLNKNIDDWNKVELE